MPGTQQPLVYLNGQFLPPDQARISVMDRGFLFGDGVYEVIPCYGGRLFRLQHHLQRLDNSLRAIRMHNPLTHDQWLALLEKLVRQLPGADQSVYLQVTRGSTGQRDQAIPARVAPTLFCMTQPAVYPAPETLARGVNAVTRPDTRWQRCDIKAITLLANLLLRGEATELGAAEAILIRDGNALEGAASNLFMVRNGTITTPPKSAHLLPGITRDLVIELAAAHHLPFREADIPVAELQQAEEIWITSSSKEVTSVVALDGQPVGNGTPGPIYRRMAGLYRDYKRRLQTTDNTT